MKKKQILVIGYAHDHCTSSAYDMANEIGREIAKHGEVVITGGLGGVMEAASKGAKEEGGTTVSIIPQEDSSIANRYSDIVIPTGIGFARDFITAYSADAVIIVGGGVGTMIEACVAYLKTKPIVALKGSGGIADQIAGTYLDDRKLIIVLGEDNPKNAVEKALSEIASR